MRNSIKCGLIALVLSISCIGHAAENPIEKADLTPEQIQRAKAFKQVLGIDKGYRSGAYVYTKRSIDDYMKEPEKLAARLAVLGFTDVYLGSEKALSGEADDYMKWQRTFIREAHKYGLKVHALRLSSAKLYVSDMKILEDCNSVINYNYSVKKSDRFDGISADLEPHILKKGFIDYPKELTLVWDSKNNFGKGKDNGLLLKRTVEVMKLAKKELRPLPLSQALGFFFQPRVNNGLLEHGGADEFLQYCDQLIVMAYNYKPSRVFEMAEPILKAAEKSKNHPKSVSVCVKTSLGTVGDEGPVTSFQTHGWDYMIEAIKYLVEKGSTYPAFRGVDIFEFQGFEMMWNNKVKQ